MMAKPLKRLLNTLPKDIFKKHGDMEIDHIKVES
jgi:hypothetical protein